jgi:hypothetical protein
MLLYGTPRHMRKSKKEKISELELLRLKLQEEVEANPRDPFSRNMLEKIEKQLSDLKEETDGKE